MTDLRSAIRTKAEPHIISESLEHADAASFEVARKIIQSGKILARSPSDKNNIPKCVCLSECTLPGLVSHCERYGRFGFVFSKEQIFAVGGRPCIYVGREEYGVIAVGGRGKPPSTPEGRLFALMNLYEPRKQGAGVKLQDYTHEREWRVFDDVALSQVRPQALFAPSAHVFRLTEAVAPVPVVPIDMLFEWGA